MSTNQDANNKGFITPVGTDRINNGDDAISTNARATVDLYDSLDTRVTTVEARREYIIQGQYVTDVANAAADAVVAQQSASHAAASAGAAASSASAAAADAAKVDAAIDTQDSAMAQVVADGTTPSQTRALLDGLYAPLPTDSPYAGSTSVQSVTAGVPATSHVTFAAPFANKPVVIATPVTGAAGVIVAVNNVTTTGFDMVCTRNETINTPIYFIVYPR